MIDEEISIGAIPAAAKDVIMNQVTGELGMVEVVAGDGQISYEAAYTTKTGKKSEVPVKPDGTIKK